MRVCGKIREKPSGAHLVRTYINSIGYIIPVILIFAILSFHSAGGRAPLSDARGGRAPGGPPP